MQIAHVYFFSLSWICRKAELYSTTINQYPFLIRNRSHAGLLSSGFSLSRGCAPSSSTQLFPAQFILSVSAYAASLFCSLCCIKLFGCLCCSYLYYFIININCCYLFFAFKVLSFLVFYYSQTRMIRIMIQCCIILKKHA